MNSSIVIPDTAEHPCLADLAWWALQNETWHDQDAPRPSGPHVVKYRPELVGLANCYGPWAVFAADGRLRGAWQHEETAMAFARDLDTPDEVWRERWESYADLDDARQPIQWEE